MHTMKREEDLHRRSAEERPRILIVGGPDVHKRIGLMTALKDEFRLSAAGSDMMLVDRFASAGFPFFYYPLVRGSTPVADLRAARCLQRLFRLYEPDIVHAFASKPCVWGRIAARASGVPIIVGTVPGRGSLYADDDFKHRVNRKIYERLQQVACRCSHVTIFQNDEDRDYFVDAGLVRPETSRIILGSGIRTNVYNLTEVPRSKIERFRAEVGFSNDTLVVTMVSRIIRAKGVMEFAEAARIVQEKFEKVRFLLVGPHDERSVDRLIQPELKYLSHRVDWIGERRDVPVILAASNIFVLPTYNFEGIPRVLLEAAAMELPLVASDVPGCSEVVRSGRNGILVPPRDVQKLAGAITTLVRKPRLRRTYGAEARKLAVKDFELEVVARETASVYRSLLPGRASPRAENGPSMAAAAREGLSPRRQRGAKTGVKLSDG